MSGMENGMINFDPIHYVAAGALVIALGLGVYNRILSAELDACSITNKTTEIIGSVQNASTKKENKESQENKESVDEKYSSDIAALQHTNRRLRDTIASSRFLPRTTQICTDSSTRASVIWPDIDAAIREYREEARRIAEEGDKAISGLNTIKEWYKKESD